MIQFLMKLPDWLLILLSRKKQIQKGERMLHAPFQFLLKLSENMVTDWETITPDPVSYTHLTLPTILLV